MGLTTSKSKTKYDPQLTAPHGFGPYGVPPRFGPGPQPNFGQGYMSNHGPVFPPGFVPQYQQMPQSQPYWPMPERPPKRRKTRNRKEAADAPSSNRHAHAPAQFYLPTEVQPGSQFPSSSNAPLATFPTPQPAPSTRRRAQTPFPRAVSVNTGDVQPQASTRSGRATPFVRPSQIPSPDSQDDDDPGGTRQPGMDHTDGNRPSPSPQPRFANTQHNTNPSNPISGRHSPPSPSAPDNDLFSSTLARNPLPPPPKDIYATTPYRPLLQLPAAIPNSTGLGNTSFPLSSGSDKTSNEGTRKPKKGLFRAFSTRKSEPKESKTQPNVQYVPVYMSMPGHAPPGPNAPHLPAHPIPAPPPIPPSGPNGPDPSAYIQNATFTNPVPERPIPHPTGRPIYFNEDTELAPLLNHSPHRVIYEGKMYATAVHLIESMKFMTTYPELAERIRSCRDVADVYPLSSMNWMRADPNWSSKFLQVIEDVAFLKFRQHPDLRSLVTNTDNRPLVYDDNLDSYWGLGPDGRGQNALGHIMERVRVRLEEVGQKKLDQTAPAKVPPYDPF